MNNFQFSILILVIIIIGYYIYKELRWIRHAVRGEPTDETMNEFFKIFLRGYDEKEKQGDKKGKDKREMR